MCLSLQGYSLLAVFAIFCALVLVCTTFISHTVGAMVILPIVQSVGAAMMPVPHARLLVWPLQQRLTPVCHLTSVMPVFMWVYVKSIQSCFPPFLSPALYITCPDVDECFLLQSLLSADPCCLFISETCRSRFSVEGYTHLLWSSTHCLVSSSKIDDWCCSLLTSAHLDLLSCRPAPWLCLIQVTHPSCKRARPDQCCNPCRLCCQIWKCQQATSEANAQVLQSLYCV